MLAGRLQPVLAQQQPQAAQMLSLDAVEDAVRAWLSDMGQAVVRDSLPTLLRAFRALDTEGCGVISPDVLSSALSAGSDGLRPEELADMLATSVDDRGRLLCEEHALRLACDARSL